MANVFRIERKLPSGWNIRLECVPYDAQLGDSRVNITDVALLELGPCIAEFDGLPYGLMNAKTQTFKLLWNSLPSALQGYLKNGYDSVTGARNIWMLFSDRGTNAVTWTMEYAGTEDNIEALELEPLGNGQFAYSTDLVDLVYYAMKTLTAQQAYDATVLPDRWVNKLRMRHVEPVNLGGGVSYQGLQIFDLSTIGAFAELKDMAWVAQAVPIAMRAISWPLLVRTSFAGPGGPTPLDANITSVPYAACKLYAVDDVRENIITQPFPEQDPRSAPVSKAYIVHSITRSNIKIGGLSAPNDQYALCADTESAYDVFRQLCEQFGVKVTYDMAYVATVGSENITVSWNVETILQGRGKASNDDTSNATLSLNNAIGTSSLIIRGENILKSEVRYETESENDITELAKIAQGSRGSRSFNVEMRVHNNTIRLRIPKGSSNTSTAPFEATNLIFLLDEYTVPASAKSIDFAIMPHAKTRYVYGPGASDYVQLAYTTAGNAYLFDMNGVNSSIDKAQEYLTWLQTWQLNGGMPATLCEFLLHVFGNENNARLSVTWPMTISEYVMPHMLGSRHTLTGTMASTFDQVVWSQAIVTGVSFDWNAGTSEVTYQILAA